MNRLRVAPPPIQGHSTAHSAIQSAKEQNAVWCESVDQAAVIGQAVIGLSWDDERVTFQLRSGDTMTVQAGPPGPVVEVQRTATLRPGTNTELSPAEVECNGQVWTWDRAAISHRIIGREITRLWFTDGVLFVYLEGRLCVDFHSFVECETGRRVLLWSETD
ncbi:hypothetical protein Pan44_45710 [Caulifigura coniformis]|uniref:Uncharacterized protein n=1 Tax=Caulifigura coniformis TaxID=2527983 RepID=A0A517SK76_9PLAN|nr:hypothetical protein [Caulifigura coniformis]QDT56516.1 hypothetical protein Pan44_45710 [Caulifigura coniformis]